MRLRSSAFAVFACTTGLLMYPVPTPAQSDQLPIREAVADQDLDYMPDRLGAIITVEATATTQAWVNIFGQRRLTVQDSTAGIELRSRNGVLFGPVVPGDRLRVRGVLAEDKGMPEIHVSKIDHLGSGSPPEPIDVLAAGLLSESYSGQLVRLQGTLKAVQSARGIFDIEFVDRSGTVQVDISSRFLDNPEFVARLLEGGAAEVTGIASQDSPSGIGGYQLAVRGPNDIKFSPVPPYLEITVGMLGALLLGALYLRRRAVITARQQQALAKELKASNRALAETEQRLHQLAANAKAVFWMTDVDFEKVFYLSPGYKEIWGRSRSEVLEDPRSWIEAVLLEDQKLLKESLEALQASPDDHTKPIVFRICRPDGEIRWIQSQGQLVRDKEGTPYRIGGLALDITERKELEIQLLQAQKMEAVGSLAGGIAHDFNNMLSVILGSAQLAALETQDQSVIEHLQEIQRTAERAAALTRRLLAFSRKETVQPVVLDLNEQVLEIGQMLGRLLGAKIRIVNELDQVRRYVNADPSQLQQVLLNLAVNARDAMPDGGTLTFRTSRVVKLDGSGGLASGTYVRLTVEDTGCGMEEELLRRIFEPFFSAKRESGGNGLGLSIVYGIVEQAGGRIEVKSVPSVGTSFDIYLPECAAPEEMPPTGSPAAALLLPEAAPLVLVVDDEDGVLRFTSRFLAKHGIEVLTASHGEEAMHLLERHSDRLDLLLTDVMMPVMGGRELGRWVAGFLPDLPVIYMSGYVESPGGSQPFDGDFIGKPFRAEVLLEKVTSALAGASRGSPHRPAGRALSGADLGAP